MDRTSERTIDVVILGLGRVGLSLVEGAVRAGLSVAGYDRDKSVVDTLNRGESPSPTLPQEMVSELMERGFRATTDSTVIGRSETAVICVPTSLSTEGDLNDDPLIDAVRAIAASLHPGMLIVIESTLRPGSLEGVVKPLLECSGLRAGRDFHLAFSPSRMDLGNCSFNLKNTPRIVGGITNACAQHAVDFYAQFVDDILTVSSPRTAEMTKLLENAYRHVNIALVNEMAQLCHDVGIDISEVIRAASTKPFGFESFYPGPGVGGCCVPIEPNHHAFHNDLPNGPFRMVQLARQINTNMPLYVVRRAELALAGHDKLLSGANILLLGVAYKADVADTHESPALAVARELLRRDAYLAYHDPYVTEWCVDGVMIRRAIDLLEESAAADLAILLQAHQIYDLDEVACKSRLLLDIGGKGTLGAD